MSQEKHATLRCRRADFARIKATLQALGGTYVTDFVHVVSYMTPEEILRAADNAGTRKMHAWQARRDAGETFSAVHRGADTDERDTDDVTPEEIDAAKRWAAMERVHSATAWKGQKKK